MSSFDGELDAALSGGSPLSDEDEFGKICAKCGEARQGIVQYVRCFRDRGWRGMTATVDLLCPGCAKLKGFL